MFQLAKVHTLLADACTEVVEATVGAWELPFSELRVERCLRKYKVMVFHSQLLETTSTEKIEAAH